MKKQSNTYWLRELSSFPTIVVANGEIPSSELSLRLLNDKRRIICCDGALQKLLSINILPDVVVGDGDSMYAEMLQRESNVYCQEKDSIPLCRDGARPVSTEGHQIPYYQDRSEEYNDLQKALKYCLANGYNNVLLMGCGGLREDHFIANLSIMAMYSELLPLAMLTEHGIFNVFRGKETFNAFSGMQVSVFACSKRSRLTFIGLKYPVNDRSFNWMWEGSLNEAIGDFFSVESDDDEPVVVYRALGN